MRNKLELGQAQPRVEDMHFLLYNRALHPELFTIHEVRHLRSKRYAAEIWAVGLSHVVMVQSQQHVVTELAGIESDLLPKVGLAGRFRFRGEKDHTHRFEDGMQHIMSTQVERMSPNLFAATHRDLLRYGKKRGILCDYPEWASGDIAPFSLIDYEVRDLELHVHAFHAFPDEQTLLKTQSIFELVPRTLPLSL